MSLRLIKKCAHRPYWLTAEIDIYVELTSGTNILRQLFVLPTDHRQRVEAFFGIWVKAVVSGRSGMKLRDAVPLEINLVVKQIVWFGKTDLYTGATSPIIKIHNPSQVLYTPLCM